MEEHIYQPFDVRMTEEGEVVVIVEPDSYIKEVIEDEKTCWEVDVDVDYDEEEHEPYLMITLHKDNAQIFMAFPYGEAWDALSEKGIISVVLMTQFDLDHRDTSDFISVTVELDGFLKGYIAGAMRMWEAISEEIEEECD